MLYLAPVYLAFVLQPLPQAGLSAARAAHAPVAAERVWSVPSRIAAPPVCTVQDEMTIVDQDGDAVFSCIDKDGNGEITQEELTEHLTSSGYTPEAVGKIFEKLDTDKSGTLSREELKAGLRNYTPLRKAPGFGNYNEEFKTEIHADADALFNSVDFDNDGEITDVELRVHLREFSKYTDAAISNVFELLDVDGNGGIDRTELRSAFVRYSALRQAIGAGPNFK